MNGEHVQEGVGGARQVEFLRNNPQTTNDSRILSLALQLQEETYPTAVPAKQRKGELRWHRVLDEQGLSSPG